MIQIILYSITKEQEVLINKTFGCTRLVYNNVLSKIKGEKSLSRFEMNKLIPSLYEEYPFLKEVDGCALRCSEFDLVNGLNKYYKKQGGYPKFKVKLYEGMKLLMKNKLIQV